MTDRSTLLVDVAELADLLTRDGSPTLLDVRWKLGGPPGRQTYETGHLPGAVFADLDADLAAPPGPRGRHPLPDPDDFAAAMRRLGVRQAQPVVVYDDVGGIVAARAWWDLVHFGHDAVRVLDGGFGAWVAAGLPVETGPSPSVASGDFVARTGRLPVVDAAGAARVASHGTLLDARAPERYRGEIEPVDPAAGHVPGAVSLPTAGLLSDGRFPAAAVLRERFASAGVRDGAPVAAYCGSGVNAAHEVLALRLAGFDDAALYAGSWSEWSADPDRAVATGPEPRPV